PHERSLAKDDDIEEERRLAFVGLTRAKEELYLTHARLREFRGQTLYAVPSMFLEELPPEGVETIDLSASAAGTQRAVDYWRGSAGAGSKTWYDAGIPLPDVARAREGTAATAVALAAGYSEGMLVDHEKYGRGRITEMSGHGAMRKLRIRFPGGERAFIADKAKLTIVTKG
ncbi:MAG TPA: 3'-5' exonuclease, partial [Gemmataceae bacterium]|nr:3'-5' exonuclease [Gemmataceae bacterium]